MTLQQLTYVVALARHQHFVHAAEACFVSQPTLTMGIKKLEEELGIEIFDRQAKPTEVTPAGKLVVQKAKAILREARQLEEIVKEEVSSIEGTFRLGVIPTISPYLLPLFLQDFVSKYGEAHLNIQELQTNEILEKLRNDELDLGILVTPVGDPAIVEIPLYYEPFLIYCSTSHPLYQQERIDPTKLKGEGLWILTEGHCFRNQVLKLCAEDYADAPWEGFTFQSGSIETLKRLVSRYKGFTLVPELSMTEEPDHPLLRRFTVPEPVREVSLVVHHSFAREGLIRAFQDCILNSIPETFRKNEPQNRVNWR